MATKIESRIIELVEGHWNAQKSPLLLAVLGLTLRREFSEDEFQQTFRGLKLREFIESQLGSALRIVRDPNNKIVWGVVPRSVQESDADLFPSASSSSTRATSTLAPMQPVMTRYERALWLAFSTPLPSASERYIIVGDQLQSIDLAIGESPPEGAIKLDEGDPAASSDPQSSSFLQVSKRIEAWATRHGLDISRFKTSTVRASKSVLDLVLETLSAEELGQTALPLNIIRTLAGRKL